MRKRTGGVLGALAAVSMLGLVAGGSLSAQETSPAGEQMAQMMDAMHGPGTVERLREALGADAETFFEQCTAMMRMMASMDGMMSPGGSPAPEAPPAGPSMQDMMRSMMGR